MRTQTMTTTAEFAKASPPEKEQLLVDGLEFVSVQLQENSLNLKRLALWLSQMPDLHSINKATLERPEILTEHLKKFALQMDSMTAECVNTAQKMNSLCQYLLSQNP